MSKKKRLGRGLEALLGVGGSTMPESNSENKPTDGTGPKKESKFAISNDGVDVESVNDLLKDNSDSTDTAPVILPFKANENQTRDLSKPAMSGNADIQNINIEKARASVANSFALSDAGSNSTPADANKMPSIVESTAPSDFAEALAANANAAKEATPSSFNSAHSTDTSLSGSTNSHAQSSDRTDSSGSKPMTSDNFSINSSDSESAPRIVELNVFDVDDNPFQPRREFNKNPRSNRWLRA